jgi:coniferyl-aldehyde dehydrogenase
MSTAEGLGVVSISGGAPTSPAELHRLYEAQRRAFDAAPIPDLAARKHALDRLDAALSRGSQDAADAISLDYGTRSRHETYLFELVPLRKAIRHVKWNLEGWMRRERRRVTWTWPGKAWVQYQPLGVVGIIGTWNYPLSLSVLPLVDALAAGNRVLLKAHEQMPHFSALLKRMLGEAFAEDQVAVVLGGVDIAEQFCKLPLDHIFFTGSTAVGRRVMAAAAENLVPVTLELGGKSPVIVAPDYSVAAAARDIAFGKLLTAGQTCIAPDYALAPAAKVRDLAVAMIAESRKLYPSIADSSYTSIATDRHYSRLRRALDEARDRGAEILTHGGEPAGAARKIGPTVVLDPPPDCTLMREEIFGPILPIIGYSRFEDAIDYVNARERPLALYCLTHDRASRDTVLSRTISGGVTLNGTIIHNGQDDLPFGGVGKSGMGSYHGIAGFRRFSHARGVYEVRALNHLHLLAPPYGRLARLVIRMLGSHRAADSC